MTVYIVTSGDYDEYGIDAVFLSKDKAQEFIDSQDAYSCCGYRDEYIIEEWETED